MVVLVCRVVGGGDGRGVALDAVFLWVMFRAGKEDTQGRLHMRATVDSGGFGGVSDVEWTWEERSAFQQDRGDKYLRQLPAHHPLLHRIHPCRFPSWKLLDTPPNPLLSRQKSEKDADAYKCLCAKTLVACRSCRHGVGRPWISQHVSAGGRGEEALKDRDNSGPLGRWVNLLGRGITPLWNGAWTAIGGFMRHF